MDLYSTLCENVSTALNALVLWEASCL